MDKLIDLDFAPGVRDTDINANFQLLHDWMTRERLRTAGWGIVEGFDLTYDLSNFTISVSEGVLVNLEGEELNVPRKDFYVGPPEQREVTESAQVGQNGVIVISEQPYSAIHHGYIDYNPPAANNRPDREELRITDALSGENIPIVKVLGKNIYVSKTDWAGNQVKVHYFTAKNRIDSIMLKADGTYTYERSVDSTNPSHVDLADYKNTFCIGVVYWTIDTSTHVRFYTDHRSYRMVYTNKKNELYLDGKRYKQAKFIYFEKPENPVPDDVWFDKDTNSLMVWEEYNGEFGWVLINDHSEVMVREHKIWSPKECPKDLQTFRFADDEMNLYYVPNTHALSIIIDNAPLMQDQFEEIVVESDKNYVSTGRGFRLKDALPEPKYVEVIVNHVVRQRPVRETFQRSAVFSSEDFAYMAASNKERIFQTKAPYVIGEDQLEVFVDGKRLLEGEEFRELTKDKLPTSAADKDKMTTWFQVISPLQTNQVVFHKITKHIWSYDQLDLLLKETEDAAKDAVRQCQILRADLTDTNGNIRQRFNEVQMHVDGIEGKLSILNQFIRKTDKIELSNLPKEIMSKLIGTSISITSPADALITLQGCTKQDYLQVFYISDNMNRILIKDKEYSLQTDGSNLKLSLSPQLVSVAAHLYVTGFKIGG